jgi:hypothetical protein
MHGRMNDLLAHKLYKKENKKNLTKKEEDLKK